MAHFTFDERETDQLYVAAKELGNQFLKAKKLAMTLHLSAPALAEIDDQIHRNTELRTMLNPRAEEEARAAARRKRGERSDPRQLDLEHEISVAAEPNGKGKKARKARKISTAPVVDGLEVANPEATQEPDDFFIAGRLLRAGVDVAPGVIDLWTSSERESALTWTQAAIAEPKLGTPEMPAHVWKAVWAGRYDYDPRAATPTAAAKAAGIAGDRHPDPVIAAQQWHEYWLEVGPYALFDYPAKSRRGPGKWEVRSDTEKAYSGPDEAKAKRVAIQRNRDTATSFLRTAVRERRLTTLIAGDGWTTPKPPKVDDVGADRVHTAAKEAR